MVCTLARAADHDVEEVRVAFTADVFAGVNRTDALASIKAWIETIATERGFQKRVVSSVYDDPESLRDAVERGGVHLAVLQSQDFLQIEDTAALDPVFTPARGDGVYDHILLLVNESSSLTDLAQLQGSRLVAHTTAGWRIGELWLNDELRRQHSPGLREFFGQVEEERSPNRVVLPVFFGNREACIISKKVFDTAAELNPQISRKLRPLLTSPGVTGSVICVWRGRWKYKEELLEGLRDLHLSVQGKQILTVFRTDRLVPFASEDLKHVRDIVGLDVQQSQ